MENFNKEFNGLSDLEDQNSKEFFEKVNIEEAPDKIFIIVILV
jgi:hypothetical protein